MLCYPIAWQMMILVSLCWSALIMRKLALNQHKVNIFSFSAATPWLKYVIIIKYVTMSLFSSQSKGFTYKSTIHMTLKEKISWTDTFFFCLKHYKLTEVIVCYTYQNYYPLVFLFKCCWLISLYLIEQNIPAIKYIFKLSFLWVTWR